jgi:CRP/FNR family transcriptional regulator, cyclic AMP receptor protein
MARTEHISRLAELELFSSCSKKDLQTIAKSSTEVDVLAGATIVEQGDMGTEAFVILDGEAVVKRNGRKIASLTAGDAIGELSLLDRGPRTAYVEAVTDMRLLRINSKDFSSLLQETPGLAMKMLASLAGRVRELDRKIFG